MSITPVSIVLSAALLAHASIATQTGGVVPDDKEAIARGQTLFVQHCASCHGKDARGNGPSSSSLTVRPGDMTQLAKKYGAFVGPHVESAIRGTNPALVHRAPNMVIWGAILRSPGGGGRDASDARVPDLIAYVKSIQQQ